MINHDCYVDLPVQMMLMMMMMMMMSTCPHAAADDDGDDVNLSTRRSWMIGKRSAEPPVSENEAERGAKDEEVRNLNVIWHNFEDGPKDSSNTACYFEVPGNVQGVLCWAVSNRFKKKKR